MDKLARILKPWSRDQFPLLHELVVLIFWREILLHRLQEPRVVLGWLGLHLEALNAVDLILARGVSTLAHALYQDFHVDLRSFCVREGFCHFRREVTPKFFFCQVVHRTIVIQIAPLALSRIHSCSVHLDARAPIKAGLWLFHDACLLSFNGLLKHDEGVVRDACHEVVDSVRNGLLLSLGTILDSLDYTRPRWKLCPSYEVLR